MAEVVFLSNTNIQIASGSSTSGGVKVSKLFSAPLPEGAVLNGVVMDKERLTQTIKTAWQTNKLPKSEVTLIINSPQLRANRIDAPILPDKKTTEFIGRETRDTEYGRFTNPVTGWYLISKNTKAKQQKVIYETAESDFVKGYVDIFESAGLKLKSIHNGVQIATEFFTKQSAGKTVIYLILDGNSLVTIFFAEGKYYYDSTSRVFSQPGTPEFAREIYSSISSIRQFMSAQRIEATVKDVVFAGLTQPQVASLSNDILNIDSQIDVSLAAAPQGTSISEGTAAFPFYVYPIAGLRKIDEKLSILKASKQSDAKESDKSGLMKLILPFGGIMALAVIVFIGASLIKASKKAELKELNDYIHDPGVLAQVAEYDAMYDSMAEIGTIQGGADLLLADINSYPIPDSSINSRILAAARDHNVNIDFKSYSAYDGVFSIMASSPIVDDINMFIADLMMMDIFENVDYTGYTLIDHTGNTPIEDMEEENYWQINVVCTLAGRDVPTEDAGSSAEEVN
ncbi:MAG: hypothetical protein J6O00_09250 [Clostridiales bacterium]|nr:hypothetical protein [Clostridiales bacterium]